MRVARQGFTIIELVIVIVISGLFLGLGYSRYRDFSKRQEVVIAKRQLEGDLRQAQADAIAGKKPSTCPGTLVGYALDIINLGTTGINPPTYEIYAICSGDSPVVKRNKKDYALSPNIKLEYNNASGNPVIFKPLTLGTNLTFEPYIITISNKTYSGMQTISVYQGGDIR